MKRRRMLVGTIIAIFVVIISGTTVLAASLGVSPASTEVVVPANSNATAYFNVYHYKGDVGISFIGIPLKFEPEIVTVDSSSRPSSVRLTIYGDESLGSKIYTGYVRFVGISEEMVTVAVRAKATITNLVEGEEPVPEVFQEPEEPVKQEESPTEEPTVNIIEREEAPELTEVINPEQEEVITEGPSKKEWPILPVAGIAAGTIVVVTLIIVVGRRLLWD